MAEPWWHYLETSEYNQRKADQFEQEARTAWYQRKRPEEKKPAGLPFGLSVPGFLEKPLEGLGWLYEQETKLTEPVRATIAKGIEALPDPLEKPVGITLGTLGGAAQGAVAGAIGGAAIGGIGAIPGAIGGGLMGGAAGLAYTRATGRPQDVLGEPFRPSGALGLIPGPKMATTAFKAARAGTLVEAGMAKTGPLAKIGQAVLAPGRAVTKRFAPDVPRAAGIEAKAIDLATQAKWDESTAKVAELIQTAVRPARAETDILVAGEKARRFTRVEELYKTLEGTEAYGEALKTLTGKYPKRGYEVPKAITGGDISNLYNKIRNANVRGSDKVATMNALSEVLGLSWTPTGLRAIGMGQPPGIMSVARLERVLGIDFANAVRSQRTAGQNASAAVMEVANLPRAILAAYDYSAPLRQGLLLIGADPRAWRQGVGVGMRAMFDPQYADDVLRNLRAGRDIHPLAPEIVEASRVHISELGGVLGATEEMFTGKLAQLFPGVPLSERVHVTSLSKMRHSALFSEVAAMERQLGRTVDLAQDARKIEQLGEAINALTGRGNLPALLQKFNEPLAFLLFSPRLLWSRFEAPALLFSRNPQVRKMAAKGLATAIGGNVALLSMLKFSGVADVEIDPRSTDFGKIRIGKTRIDLFGGYQPIMRYGAQLFWGERKTTVAGEFYGVDPRNVLFDFLRTKLSPVMGIVTDVVTGETMIGDPITGDIVQKESEFWDQVQQRFIPMFIQDLKEAIAESGLVPGAFMALPGAFGGGVMSYAWPSQKLDTLSREHMGQGWKDLNFLERKQFIDRVPEAQDAYAEYIEMGVKRGQPWAIGVYESLQSRAEFEERLGPALTDPSKTKANIAKDYQGYRSSVGFTGDPDREPRDAQEALAMEYWAIKPEDFLEGGLVVWGNFYDARDAFLEVHPGVKPMLEENELLKWETPAMRAFVKEYQAAEELRSQYFDIPTKIGMSPEGQKAAKKVDGQIRTLQQMHPGLERKQALVQLPIEARLKFLVVEYWSLDSNPARKVFRMMHPEVFEMFPPIGGAGVPMGWTE